MPKKEISENGPRGVYKMYGEWVDLKEAKQRGLDTEWWKEAVQGQSVPVKQYIEGAPTDKPIWMYHDGDMYLGEWKGTLEHGFGITYSHCPFKFRGQCYVGTFQNGYCH